MPEKKYLEVYHRGRLYGAFENVRNFQENPDKTSISFDSDDGSFIYTKNNQGFYECDENEISFDTYRLIGRRTLLRDNDTKFNNMGKSVNVNNIDYVEDEIYSRTDADSTENTEGLNRLIWDDCTPTRDRRPTTSEDIEDDIHVIDYSDADEVLEKICRLAGYDVDEVYDEMLEDNPDTTPSVVEAINYVKGYFSDFGDGSPNILYCCVNGQEVIKDLYDCLRGYDLKTISEEEAKDVIQYAEFGDMDISDDDEDVDMNEAYLEADQFEKPLRYSDGTIHFNDATFPDLNSFVEVYGEEIVPYIVDID